MAEPAPAPTPKKRGMIELNDEVMREAKKSGILKKDLIQIRLGVCMIIWAIWNTRNDFIFNKTKNTHFFRLSLWLPTGSVCGLISNKKSSGTRWILGATIWRR
jgi:hypothetical protein